MNDLPEFLTATEVAVLLRISTRTVQRMTADKTLPHICVRGDKRYSAAAIQKLVVGGRSDA